MKNSRCGASPRRLFSCALLAAMFVVCMPVLPAPDLPSGISTASCSLHAASRQSVKSQKRRLKRLQRSIEKTRTEIRQMKKKETSVVKSLNVYQRHSQELASSIGLLDAELGRVQDSIVHQERSLESLQQELQKLQSSYAELARTLQKAGIVSDKELILTGKSYEQDVRDSRYVQNITEQANAKAREIVQLKDEITWRRRSLDTLFVQNQDLKERKAGEQQELGHAIATSRQVLKDIRNNKSQLEKQLAEKHESAGEIQRIIALLAVKEKQRKLEEKRRQEAARRARAAEKERAVATAPSPRSSEGTRRSQSFTGGDAPDNPATAQPQEAGFSRRSLPWPVGSRTIIHKFGTSTNPGTGVATENLGIGIKTARGTSVSAVYNGIVSLVHWLPGYGSLVIVDHGNGFRTVYANLSAVGVSEGERVRAGQSLGRSGESVDGEYVHFEIWRDREKLNPGEWLN